MGCFGIGITRLMGVVVEAFADEKGIVWPESIAPAKVHLILLQPNDAEVKKAADTLYEELQGNGVEILYDYRDVSAGEKFSDADLIGIPHRIVVSKKTLAEGKVEYKKRIDTESRLIARGDVQKTVLA